MKKHCETCICEEPKETPKSFWIRQEDPEQWVCEYLDCEGHGHWQDTAGRIERPRGESLPCRWLCEEHFKLTEQGGAQP